MMPINKLSKEKIINLALGIYLYLALRFFMDQWGALIATIILMCIKEIIWNAVLKIETSGIANVVAAIVGVLSMILFELEIYNL